jgi:hypothetical protein
METRFIQLLMNNRFYPAYQPMGIDAFLLKFKFKFLGGLIRGMRQELLQAVEKNAGILELLFHH